MTKNIFNILNEKKGKVNAEKHSALWQRRKFYKANLMTIPSFYFFLPLFIFFKSISEKLETIFIQQQQ